MIDSWNAAKLNERITQVEKKIQAKDVIANPTGEATAALGKISIDGVLYNIPNSDIVFVTLDNTDFIYDSDTQTYAKSYTAPEGKSIISIGAYATNSSNIIGVRYSGGTISLKATPNFSSADFTFIVTIILK